MTSVYIDKDGFRCCSLTYPQADSTSIEKNSKDELSLQSILLDYTKEKYSINLQSLVDLAGQQASSILEVKYGTTKSMNPRYIIKRCMQRLVKDGLVYSDITLPNTWTYVNTKTEMEIVMAELDKRNRLKQLSTKMTKEYMMKLIRSKIKLNRTRALKVYDELIEEGFLWDNGDEVGWNNIIQYQRHERMIDKSKVKLNRRYDALYQ
jgi:hypothetical protein